jgi:hypothetical protein
MLDETEMDINMEPDADMAGIMGENVSYMKENLKLCEGVAPSADDGKPKRATKGKGKGKGGASQASSQGSPPADQVVDIDNKHAPPVPITPVC